MLKSKLKYFNVDVEVESEWSKCGTHTHTIVSEASLDKQIDFVDKS